MASATSSGSSSRRMGMSAMSFSVSGDKVAVSIFPGDIALTLMPRGPKSVSTNALSRQSCAYSRSFISKMV